MKRIRPPKDPNNPNPIIDDTSFDLGDRFGVGSMAARYLGGMSRGLDFGTGQRAMQDVLARGSNLDPKKYSLDQQAAYMKDAIDRVAKELGKVLPPDLVNKVREQASQAATIWQDLREDALGMKASGDKRGAARTEAMANTFLSGGVGSTLEIENQQKLLQYIESLKNNNSVSAKQARALTARAAAGLNSNEILAGSDAGRFFTEGYYGSYMRNNRNIEAGSAQFNALVAKSRRGVAESVRTLEKAKQYEDLGGFGRMIGGVSAKDLGIDQGRARKVLTASLAASRDRLREINATERKARAGMARATRGLSGAQREAAAKPFEEVLRTTAESRKNVSTTALEAAKELSENIKKPFMEAGASFKSSMVSIINGIKGLGDEISKQISGLGRATLNPVVTDLIESIKYGLGIGMQAGMLITNATKGTLDGLAKTFGVGGGLGNLFSGGGAAIMGGIGKFVKGAGIALGGAALGYGLGELIRGGISKDAREGLAPMTEAEKRTNVYAGTVQGAVTGAALGFSVAGVGGAAVGGLIGGGIGWFNSKNTADQNAAMFAENQKKEAEAKKAQKEAQDAELKNNLNSGFISGITSFADIDKMMGQAGNFFGDVGEAGKSALDKVGSVAKPALDKIKEIGDTKLTLPVLGEVDVKGLATGVTAVAGASVLAGNLPGAGAARGLLAAGSGLLGGAAIGVGATIVDFFIKSLERGAQELGKFSQISNNLNIGMSMQLRRLGNVRGESKGIGEKTKLTEADLAQSLLTSTRLIDIGFNREQVGAAYSTMNRVSYEGTTSATRTLELAGRAARQLGVDINEMIKSYAETDILGGIGKGSDIFNRMLFNIAPRTQDGDVSAMSKAYTEAILNSARQLQMGAKTVESGTSIAGLLGSMAKATQGLNNSFSQFAQLSPQVYGETVSSVNSFLKGGLTGDPLAVSLAARAGLDRRIMYEGIQGVGDFESVLTGIGSLLSGDPALLAGGEISELAKKTILPDLLNRMMPGVSTEQFSTFYSLASSGKVSEAYKDWEKEGKPMDLKEIAKQIGQGFNALQKAAEEGMQQNLKLMESNLGIVQEISNTANDVAGNLLSMGKSFLKPAIDSLSYPLTALRRITELANNTVKEQAEAKKKEADEAKKAPPTIPGFSGGPLNKEYFFGQVTENMVDTAEKRIALSRQQILQESAADFAEKTKKGGKWSKGSTLEEFTGDLSYWNSKQQMPQWLQSLTGVKGMTLGNIPYFDDKKGFITSIFENLKDENYMSTIFSSFNTKNVASAFANTDIGASLQNLFSKNIKIGGQSFSDWFNTYSSSEDVSSQDVIKALTDVGLDFKTAKDVLQAESIRDLVIKAKQENVDVRDTAGLLAYAAGGGTTKGNAIYEAVMSGKQYIFLANDMSVMTMDELKANYPNVK